MASARRDPEERRREAARGGMVVALGRGEEPLLHGGRHGLHRLPARGRAGAGFLRRRQAVGGAGSEAQGRDGVPESLVDTVSAKLRRPNTRRTMGSKYDSGRVS